MKVVATDLYGLQSIRRVNFTVAGAEEAPIIENISYIPSSPGNESNVVVYANITSFYRIKNVSIVVDGMERKMFRYASCPRQPRHEEDVLVNQSNEPRYGVELGQMEKGEHVFFVVATDTAGNEARSEEYVISVS